MTMFMCTRIFPVQRPYLESFFLLHHFMLNHFFLVLEIENCLLRARDLLDEFRILLVQIVKAKPVIIVKTESDLHAKMEDEILFLNH